MMSEQKIKRVWISVQVFTHKNPMADLYEDVYFVEKTKESLTLWSHNSAQLWKEIIPMKEISFFRICEEIEYQEDLEDE